MKRSVARSIGYTSYALAMAAVLWLVPFMADRVPRSVDRGPATDPVTALVVDLALLLVFAFQHSVMARGGFKAWTAHLVPAAVERSSYVLASAAALGLLFVGWHPIPILLWDLETPFLRVALWSLFGVGFALMFSSTWVVDHFDLFGVKQVRRFAVGEPYDPPELKEVLYYRFVRHPLYLGWLIFFWATPTMTVGHLFLALFMTAYILVAIPMEERDLIATLGSAYRDYRDRVPKLVPARRR